MTAFQQQTLVRSFKLKIKNTFKSIDEETENIVATLQSRVSWFRKKVDALVLKNDENFFPLHKSLCGEIEKYQESLFFIQALLEVKDNITEDNKVENIDTKECDPSNSDLEQVPPQRVSSQTFCKTLYSENSLISSKSYCSLQDNFSASQLQLSERQKSSEKASKASLENIYVNKIKKKKSFENTDSKFLQYSKGVQPESHSSSPNSSYYSLSSAITSNKVSKASINLQQYERQETSEIVESDSFEQCREETQQTCNEITPDTSILPLSITIPSVITATLSHQISPDDFWVQLEDSKEWFSFPSVEFSKKTIPTYVQPGDFCLALSNKVNIYYRARVLTHLSHCGSVEVFFIDLGSIQSVYIMNLRVLPEPAYQIPMRAIHCCLCDISPVSGSWSSSSIEKFKEYEGSCKVQVESLNGGKYGVQLMIKVLDYDLNISEVLCEEGFAVFKEASIKTQTSSFQPIEMSNQMSHDSGVSITSNQRSSPYDQRLCISSEMIKNGSSGISSEPLQRKVYPDQPNEMNPSNFTTYFDARNLISFESSEHMYNVLLDNTEIENELSTYTCSRTAGCECVLHLVIPPPFMSCVEKDMMLIMISNIVSPSEFYVNPAMEDSCAFDELREQMTAFYESLPHDYYIVVEDIYEGMFCAGRFHQDGNWYRVKVLEFELENSSNVLVQYIDYGNKASIKCSELRPLKPQFVQHPSFAIKCSLAGIIPRICEDDDQLCSWSEDAVTTFQQLVSFDRCLTAQIVENSMPYISQESDAVPVLLWDTVDADDLLINEVLVEKRAAEIDYNLVSFIQNQKSRQSKEVALLNQWNPMHAEFIDVENSYGVDTDSIGVLISGYKQQDDSRICKYFSLRGYCPRGKNCTYEHVPLAEGGVTRDQMETYSLDTLPKLPEPSTHVFIQVSSVISPVLFYSILPFGSKTVDEVDSLARQDIIQELSIVDPWDFSGFTLLSETYSECFAEKKFEEKLHTSCDDPESWGRTEIRLLFQELTRHYSSSPFSENTAIALSYGSIVVAWRSVDSAWHRGRIIDVSDITGPAKVFFVDFGDDSWVPRKKIREILPQFLHTPFQAIECHLSDVEPLGFENGNTWSPHAINYFKEMVSNSVLLAKVTDRCGKILHLTLRKTGRNDCDKISESLVRAGFAQYCSYNTSENKSCIYVPG